MAVDRRAASLTGMPEGPTVALMLMRVLHRAKRRIIERAMALGWRIVDLEFYDGKLPPGLVPDGALVERLWDEPLVRQLRELGCPTVRCASFPNPHDHEFPAVAGDLPTAGRLAAEHFAERGFRHVGSVGYEPLSNFEPLYEAFRSRAEELGAECHLLGFKPFGDAGQGFTAREKHQARDRELTTWLKAAPKPIGMLGFSDGMAARICVRSLDAGLQVPGEVAVIGCGNAVTTCECTPVPLSAIEHGGEEEGERAVQLLQDLMAGKPPPSELVLVPPREVTVRASTDVLATVDPVVARAVRFMWDHLAENLSVDDVADAVSVNRRALERLFRRELDRGVNAELRRRRLEVCCALLRTTELSVSDLAPRIGFRSKHHLHTSFRAAFGCTPLQFRQRRGETA